MGDGYSGSGDGAHADIAVRLSDEPRLLSTLEQLLAIDGTNVKSALERASDLIAGVLGSDKVDVFLYDPSTETLVALGTSRTPMGLHEQRIGLNRLPLANASREAEVFYGGKSFISGRVEEDPLMPHGIVHVLGVRSTMITPVTVGGQRRGVLQACSASHDAFSERDLLFLEAVANWVGTLTHRAELIEQVARDAAVQGRQTAAEELITILAHDLGNFITPIKGHIDIIQRRAAREGKKNYLADASAAARGLERLRALTQDLLDLGRLEQGIFSLRKQPLDLARLVEDTADTMQTPEQVVKSYVPEELIIEADLARLRQALENLIANALKHSPRNMPVEVELRSEKRLDREWAIITVTDLGPGVPQQIMPNLFTRFVTGPGSTGLGLGLYLARSIADAHGGTLELDQTHTPGASFRMSLRLSQ